MNELICIICPNGCRLQIDKKNNYKVSGNSCEKGVQYAKSELLNPLRTITSTVKVKSHIFKRCPVKTDKPIPKSMMFDAMKLLDNVLITAPIKTSEIIINNILGLEVNFIATADIPE